MNEVRRRALTVIPNVNPIFEVRVAGALGNHAEIHRRTAHCSNTKGSSSALLGHARYPFLPVHFLDDYSHVLTFRIDDVRLATRTIFPGHLREGQI